MSIVVLKSCLHATTRPSQVGVWCSETLLQCAHHEPTVSAKH